MAFAFWDWMHKGHFFRVVCKHQGQSVTVFSPCQNTSQVWLPLYKTHPAMFTVVGLVDMHCEQGNCVYLDMQGHDRPVKPKRRLQGGFHVIHVPWISVPVQTRHVHPQEPLSFTVT